MPDTSNTFKKLYWLAFVVWLGEHDVPAEEEAVHTFQLKLGDVVSLKTFVQVRPQPERERVVFAPLEYPAATSVVPALKVLVRVHEAVAL
jgi:hypothetical protein